MNEQQLEILEKIFPNGFVTIYKIKDQHYQLAALTKKDRGLELVAIYLVDAFFSKKDGDNHALPSTDDEG